MRNLCILLTIILCSSCQLRTFDIPKAPLKPEQAVIFDIDGTLTPKPSAYSKTREDAAHAVRLFADNGYKIIYLSARRKIFQFIIPRSLVKGGFPEGSIQVPQTSTDSSDHAAFKIRIMKEYQENGWTLVAAYGDSSTDFQAYAAVGIDKESVFALRRVGDDSCQPGIWAKCLDSWSEHIDRITEIVQP